LLFRRETRSLETFGINDKEFLEALGVTVDGVNVTGMNSLKEATIYTCTRILSESLSKLPLRVYREVDGSAQAVNHPLNRILKLRPNPLMSSMDLFKAFEAHRAIGGNSYGYIESNNRGIVRGLHFIDPDKMTIYMDDVGLVGPRNKLWYVVQTDYGEIKLEHDEVLHFKAMTLNGITGLSVVDRLRHSVENAKSSQEYINKFFKNGLSVKGIIQYVGDLDEKSQDTFRTKFESMSSSLKNAHRVTMLPIGYKFEPISLNMTDAQFLENTKLTIQQLTAAVGVKLHQVNEMGRATFNNISEQNREFYVDTMQATLTGYEQEMTYKLLTDRELDQGYYIKFNVDALLRADIKTRYEAYKIAIQSGFKSPNEIRKLEEDPAKEGADDLLCNGNMQKVSEVGAYYKNKGGEGAGKGSKQDE